MAGDPKTEAEFVIATRLAKMISHGKSVEAAGLIVRVSRPGPLNAQVISISGAGYRTNNNTMGDLGDQNLDDLGLILEMDEVTALALSDAIVATVEPDR